MDIIPTLFLQNGKVVSLYKGNENAEKKTYPKAPKTYVQWFEEQGARELFVVDLDGDQLERLDEFRPLFSGEIWWAGQVRDIEKLAAVLEHGADRVVLGRSAEPLYTQALEEFGPQKLVVGLQVTRQEGVSDWCESMSQYGFGKVLVKDLNAEGTLFHPSFDLMEKCVYFSGKEVYASGGVSQERDIQYLKKAGVKGVVIGRALYENQLNLEELLLRYGSE